MQLQVTGEHFVSEVSKKITWRLDYIPKKFYNLVQRKLLTAVQAYSVQANTKSSSELHPGLVSVFTSSLAE